ncbi:hypothetical protein E4U26_006156 [Claviceps purpurea]|nr:hypothetical protein E4U26_006156 [Claviceps purpurea]
MTTFTGSNHPPTEHIIVEDVDFDDFTIAVSILLQLKMLGITKRVMYRSYLLLEARRNEQLNTDKISVLRARQIFFEQIYRLLLNRKYGPAKSRNEALENLS